MKLLSLILITAATAHASIVEDVMFLAKHYNPTAQIRAVDTEYSDISTDALKEIAKEFSRLLSRADKRGNPAVFDCDDFARVFKSVVALQGLKDGKNYACAVIGVKQIKAFGGVPREGNALHMLNLIILEGTPIVLEPQTLQTANLFKYPNNKQIIEVNF